MKEVDQGATSDAEAWTDVNEHLHRYGRSGAQPKSLKSVLNKLLVKRGYNQRQVNTKLIELWASIEPAQWRGQCHVKGYKRGTLEIRVENPAIAQQLEFSKQQLLLVIKQKSPELKIKNLRFSLS